MPTADMESREYWHVRVCVHTNVRMFMCVVSRLTGSPAGEMGKREKENCSSPRLCLAGKCEWRGLWCGGRRQTNSSNRDLPQDPGFDLADMILSWHGCSKASRGCIPSCLSSGMTARSPSWPGPAWISSCSSSKVLYPSQVCRWVGKPATREAQRILDVTYHPREAPLRCVREDRVRRAAGRG